MGWVQYSKAATGLTAVCAVLLCALCSVLCAALCAVCAVQCAVCCFVCCVLLCAVCCVLLCVLCSVLCAALCAVLPVELLGRFHIKHCGSMMRLFRLGMLPLVHSAHQQATPGGSGWHRRGNDLEARMCNCCRCLEPLADQAARAASCYWIISFSLNFEHQGDRVSAVLCALLVVVRTSVWWCDVFCGVMHCVMLCVMH